MNKWWLRHLMNILEYHEESLRKDPTWTITKTGKAFGMSQPYASVIVRLAQDIRENPDLYANADSRNEAYQIWRAKNRKKVVITNAKVYMTGHIEDILKSNRGRYFLVRLDRPIDTEQIEIRHLAVASHSVRIIDE